MEGDTERKLLNQDNTENIQTGSKGKLIGIVVGIILVIIVGVIIGVVIVKNKKEKEKTEVEKFREAIQAKIRTAHTTDPSSDKTKFILMHGNYIQMTDKYLEIFNTARKKACDEGLIDPRTQQKLTEKDYVAFKWSTDLEKIARIRASETTIKNSNELRPNGVSSLNMKYNNIENIAEITDLMETMEPELISTKIDAQYQKYKADPQTKDAEDYKKIIDTGNKIIAISYFEADTYIDGTPMAVEFGNATNVPSSSYLNADKDVYQTVDVLSEKIGRYKIEGSETMSPNAEQDLIPRVNITTIYPNFPNVYAWPNRFHYYEFSSDNLTVVNVTVYGKAKSNATGVAIITLSDEAKKSLVTMDIKVECNHVYEYHYYKDEEGKTYGKKVCKICGETTIFHPPNNVEITWRNNVTSPEEFNITVPDSNPIGSTIEGKFAKDGEEEYGDMLLNVSKEGFIDTSVYSEGFEFVVLKEGKVNVTFYPKYNVNYTQTFELPLGN